MSQVLMSLSTEPVAITQSLYLHQSAVRISFAWAAMLSVGRFCRKSQILVVQSPEQLRNTSACAGFLQDSTIQGKLGNFIQSMSNIIITSLCMKASFSLTVLFGISKAIT